MTRLWRIDEFLSPQPMGDEYPSLEAMQDYLRGFVEVVHTVCGDQIAYLHVNSEGKLKGMRPNVYATAVLHAELQRDAGRRSYSDYALDNPFECLPDSFNDMVCGPALVWIGPLPPEELN